jgi:hypothetical protein
VATIQELAAGERIHCSVRGRITRCGDGASGLRVVCVHHQQIGFPDENERCRGGLPTFRTVGDVRTDSDGDFAFAFDALTRPFGACSFLSRARVDVYDGATRVWASGYRAVAPLMRFDRELVPNCTPGSTAVRVVDDDGAVVAGAEVFANGTLRGRTDATGHIFADPPLEAGDELVARLLIHENGSPKDGHDVDSDRNWNYRVWITSLSLRHDANGDVRLPQYTISDPDEVQELRLRARNALIGLNLRASIEWDASSTEFNRIHDRLCDLSELVYNGTDGQFFVAELALSDDGHSWEDADVRIYANMNQGSKASKCGIFEHDGRIRMNPNDAYFAGDYLHELGHYAFGLGDEYEGTDEWDPDNGDPRCTLKSTDPDGPFSNGNEKDACFMRGARYEDQKKLCSAHPDNPHVAGTEQGRQDCWTGVLELYSDDDRRWRLLTPVNRAAIVGRFPDSGVRLKGLTEPSGVARPPSFIPLADWKPHDHNLRVQHVGLCEGLIVRVTRGGTPVIGALVMLHTSQDRSIYQGQTKTKYELAYGVQTGPGEVPVHGAHVGDFINVYELRGAGFVQIGRKRIESCTERLVVEATLGLPAATEASPFDAPPSPAPVMRSVWPSERTILESRDGRFRVALPPGALADASLVRLEEMDRGAAFAGDEEIVAGPYALTGPPKRQLKVPGEPPLPAPVCRGADGRSVPRRPPRGGRIRARDRVQGHARPVRRDRRDRRARDVCAGRKTQRLSANDGGRPATGGGSARPRGEAWGLKTGHPCRGDAELAAG